MHESLCRGIAVSLFPSLFFFNSNDMVGSSFRSRSPIFSSLSHSLSLFLCHFFRSHPLFLWHYLMGRRWSPARTTNVNMWEKKTTRTPSLVAIFFLPGLETARIRRMTSSNQSLKHKEKAFRKRKRRSQAPYGAFCYRRLPSFSWRLYPTVRFLRRTPTRFRFTVLTIAWS